MIAKSVTLDADMVFLDLEDAVAAGAKAQARTQAVEAFSTLDWGERVTCVRINDATTPWTLDDLVDVIGVVGDRIDTVLVPKVEDAGQVAFVDHVLTQLERRNGWPVGRLGLELQVESANGLVNAASILAASARIETFVFGPGDMAAALGMPSMSIGETSPDYPGDHWHSVLTTIVVQARARGIQPIDGPFGAIRDQDGFINAARRSRALGFDGKWVLHPDQIAPCNEIFGVTQQSYERACDLLDAYEYATGDAQLGAVTFGDEMIDEASRKMAQVTAARGAAQGLAPRTTPDEVPFHARAAWRDEHLTA